MNSNDVKNGAPPCVGPNGVPVPACLQINELTLAERQRLNEATRQRPLSREEAERYGYRPAEIEAWFASDLPVLTPIVITWPE